MANIVVLAKNHNPAIASVDWLKKIISDEEDAINFTNTPVFSVCEFQSFIFTVTPDHLQVVPKTPSEPNVPKLQKVVSNYIEALPETPYTAVGLNYIWIVSFDSQEDASGLLKRLFIADESRIKTSLERNNYQAGGILVFEDEIFRTRLLVEAVKEFPNNISCNFNYHSDVKDFKYALQAISVYQEKNIESKQIVSHLFEIG
jgi:hypothetical protein